MSFKATIRKDIKFPTLNMQNQLEFIGNRIVIPLIVKGIDSRKDLNGDALPELSLQTIKRKGHDRPLVETGELRRSPFTRRVGQNKVIVTMLGTRREIAGHLQNDGVGKSRKKFLFFGITKEMEAFALNYLREDIRRRINARR